jgi:hypothetical protein
MAATVAAAAVPLALAQPETVIQPVITPLRYKRRIITDLKIEPHEDFEKYPGGRIVEAKLMRGDSPMLQWGMNSRGWLIWSSGGDPMMALVDLPGHPISASFEPDVVPGLISIAGKYEFDDGGRPLWVHEEHFFKDGQHSTELWATDVDDQKELDRRIRLSG